MDPLAAFVITALMKLLRDRVVTAVITGGIIAGSEIAAAFHFLTLILIIVAGSVVFSYVTDPFFQIVQKATGETIGGVIRRYTLPLAACGFVILGVACNLTADCIFCHVLTNQVLKGRSGRRCRFFS